MDTKKTLVVYFSHSGNTRAVARTVAALTGGNEFRIETVKSYPEGYTETTEVAKEELRLKARPELKGLQPRMEDYNLIIVAYPNWWGTMPMAVFTFLESYDLAGKTILPLCTHEGSRLGHSEADLRQMCPQSQVLKGLAVQGNRVAEAEADLKAWLRESQIVEEEI